MNLEQALYHRIEAQQNFETLLNEKVDNLAKHYNRPNLTDQQIFFLKKDEALCKAAEHLINTLSGQLTWLIQENKKQLRFMEDMQRDVNHYQEMFINATIENKELKAKAGELKFSFNDAECNQ